MQEQGKSYKILAEIYDEENQLVLLVVENKYGKVMQVRKNVLEQWNSWSGLNGKKGKMQTVFSTN